MRASDFTSGVERVKRRILSMVPRKHSDPVVLLMKQHREVDALFMELEGHTDLAHRTKEKALKELVEKLTLHTELEERIFYPAARAADAKLVLEAVEEHDNVKSMLKKLQATDVWDTSFTAKIKVLRELVHHHVREEEFQLFPKCELSLGREKLDDLGTRMQEQLDEAKRGGKKKAAAHDDGDVKHADASENASGEKAAAKAKPVKKAKQVTKH